MEHGLSEIRSAQVDQRGLLRVLGENLYSDPAVVVRELVQNAHDSITRRELEGGSFAPRIEVFADPATSTLRVRDTGAGLTEDEIHAFLATIGAGMTRLMRAEHADERLIGAFGLGFLSCYVVSERVEVLTTSHREPGSTWLFRSADGLRYSVSEAPSGPPGTEVTLHLRASHRSLSDAAHVRSLLARYARLLPHPVFAPGRVNDDVLPWRLAERPHPRRYRRALLEVAATFEAGPQAIAAFPVEPGDRVDVRGALWIHGAGSWATSDQRRVALYVRGMFVSDEVRAVLPEWAGFVGGVLECDALVPTASREDVQRDAVFQALQARVAEALVAGLCALVSEEPEAWRRMLLRHADALRGAALADPRLFDALVDDVPVPTSEGDRTLPEVVVDGRIHATAGDDAGHELVLHRALGRPVVEGVRYGALALAQRYAEARGATLVVLGTEAARALFPAVRCSPAERERLERWFGGPDLGVVPTRFAPASVAVLRVPDRDVLLKRRLAEDDADERVSRGVLGLARGFTDRIADGPAVSLYVNLDAPVIARILTSPPAVADPIAAVLSAFADLAGRRNGEGSARDLGATLGALEAALLALLPP